MTQLAERLDALTATVFAPDQRIEGRVRGVTVDVRFHEPDLHRHLGAEALGHQLERLLSLVAVARVRTRREILTEFGFEHRALEHTDARYQRFRRAASELRGAGASHDRAVAVATIGLRAFKVRLEPKPVRDMSETEFRQAFRAASSAMIADYTLKSKLLKNEMLGAAGS
ncbi:MAG TPA: hypothetical protein VE172_09230 [Stackebrandtia sp.]|jgi:hypothetical protein|uniref:hypothetical protein n=1 Tax=Stackebrandtia sp. TaxID=2023065 RepID=UPI002D43520D|nr:hypothetical protein [Stackebrandtia sp.]HZE38979.1 hypothetical protein [Stackebrandtia sp.]